MSTINSKTICRECGGEMKVSKAMNNVEIKFKGENKFTKDDNASLVDCLKCTSCGHSIDLK